MPKYFPSITHCKVVMPHDAKDMESLGGTLATVILCFSNEDDVLQPIQIKKMPGPVTGVIAEIPVTTFVHKGKTVFIPILKGKPADEIKLTALIAFDKVKQKYGLKFGKKYRVAGDVEEIVQEQTAAK